MLNDEIAGIFERMARVLSFKGANRFRIIAYERAAQALTDVSEDLTAMARDDRLKEIPGIGADLEGMIREYIRTKRIRKYDDEREGISDELIELMGIPGLGPKTLAQLHEKLGVSSLQDLKRALESDSRPAIPGFGDKKVENLRRGVELWQSRRQRLPLGSALPLAERLLDHVRRVRGVDEADLAGSLRRRLETIGDIDVVVAAADRATALKAIVRLPEVREVLALGDTKATILIENNLQVDVRAVDPESYGAALQYFTGSKQHNVHLRTLARRDGLKINEYGVFRGEKRLGGSTEEDVYRLMGMPLMPPEIREDRGEIEAASAGALPALVDLAGIRGDLHVHSDHSDGRATMAEMAEAAERLGYEYLAIADHSPSARVARGLDEERLAEKIEEFERLRSARRKKRPRLLLGAEVDILPDGSLDYPDKTLSRFDVVTASIHSAFKQSRDSMTGRLLDAISNPHVHIIGHPTARLIGSRDPVAFDLDRVIRAAVDRGVALEINASPLRLDLNDTMCRAAGEAGALVAINSDAHSAPQLEQMRYGVFQARRGWIGAGSVVNCRNLAKLTEWLQRRKR
ncbi:MAG TPA: DNA polymerase/3'-5' exonuclease PolX [Terriglobia bacterium]|nr:DNA polymerase/3'-5' exonuclease PolX [Terriglobia bacterium]